MCENEYTNLGAKQNNIVLSTLIMVNYTCKWKEQHALLNRAEKLAKNFI